MRRAAPPGVAVLEHEGEPAALLEAWRDAARVVVVDAVAGGAEPGTVLRLDAGAAPLPATRGGASTHGVGVAEAIELGRALGRLPGRLVVFCVEGEDFGTGRGLTPRVGRAVGEVVAAVLAEVDSRG